ncbi:Arachidonate 12-lipoxygenase, epidermal-type [Sciurus carolinensis]|uniref:Arachidonate 12-lipoxygenase, epidermal-type n=1 Tax=Sciurus carolinensis TaxID=30640 RepID=A0AA41MEQ1_SCICA|nr:Arachidonate 12-lipoxygenase, epidermal-type [Sciurus carolinensis]
MGKYMIRVATRDSLLTGSTNLVQLWLVGEHREADLGKLLRPLPGRVPPWVSSEGQKEQNFFEDIQTPLTSLRTPYLPLSWIQDDGIHCLPDTAWSVSDDPQNLFKKYREQELEDRRKVYLLKDLAIRVCDSWKDEDLFGYQFLNGTNPMLLRHSTSLPPRLVLPPGMEDLQTQLDKEHQKPNVIIFKQQYVAAPSVMLKLQPDGRLLPVVIQLLIPHFHYTMEINILARNNLVSEYGIFDLVLSTGSGGHVDILWRAIACLTYRSFCPPHDLADRGLLGVKSSLYGQDALRLWDIISRYVQGMVRLFYKSDEAVKHDSELQAWCREITETGLQGAQDLDWYSWIPNGPCTMRKPPSISKDVTEMDIVDSLPDLHQAHMQKTFIKFFGRRQPVMVALGQHREKYFSGPGPQAVLKQFQEELAVMDREIKVRNAGLDLPYEYLQPSMVENSVTI